MAASGTDCRPSPAGRASDGETEAGDLTSREAGTFGPGGTLTGAVGAAGAVEVGPPARIVWTGSWRSPTMNAATTAITHGVATARRRARRGLLARGRSRVVDLPHLIVRSR